MLDVKVSRPLLAGLFIAVIALLPFGRLSELPILCLACWGLVILVSNWQQLLKEPAFKLFSMTFVAYFLITVISAFDSFWPQKSWLVAWASWRFYLMGVVLLYHAKDEFLLPAITKGVVMLMVIWAIDALIQAALGVNSLGMPPYPGRLTGVFAQNVKLGPVLALFLPLVMIYMCRYRTWARWTVVTMMLLVILLSGTRSAWLMAGFVLLMFWWHHVQGRRGLLFLKAALLAVTGVVGLWLVSDDFRLRVDRSIQMFDGGVGAIDFALADRLPIWQTAINMFQSHPVNGVGARAFRVAYESHAEADDVWLAQQGSGLHAHHWILELLAETGTIGLLLMSAVLWMLSRRMHQVFRGSQVWPHAVALMAALLPVVSLYSLFSSFWSICLWWLFIMLMLGWKNAQS